MLNLHGFWLCHRIYSPRANTRVDLQVVMCMTNSTVFSSLKIAVNNTCEKLRILLPLLATVTPSFGALLGCLLATYEGTLGENSNPVRLVSVVVRLYLNLTHITSAFSFPLTHERSSSRLQRIQPTSTSASVISAFFVPVSTTILDLTTDLRWRG
jgi:hypothetical protein